MFSDFRYAARSLSKHSGPTALVILIVAVVIGANTTVFSIVDGVFLEPVPFAEPDRLVTIENGASIGEFRDVNLDALNALRERSRTLESIAGYAPGLIPRTVESPDGPFTATVGRATANLLNEVLGVPVLLGRGLAPSDEAPGAPGAAVISHPFWQRRFGGDPDVIGQTLEFARTDPVVIVGVLGPGFRSPRSLEEAEDIIKTFDAADGLDDRFGAIGRLAPGTTLDTARTELGVIGNAVAAAGGEPMEGSTFQAEPATNLFITDSERTSVLLFFAAVLAVLLIGIANLAGFELARLPRFQGDMAVRAAMGASRWQLVRFVLLRTLLLGLSGGILGTGIAALLNALVLVNLPASVPRRTEIQIDGSVLAFAIGVAVIASVLIALPSALRSSRTNVAQVIHRASRVFTPDRGYRLFQDGLIVFEVGSALVLMIAAGLLLHNFWTLMTVDRGFDPEQLMAVAVAPSDTYRGTAYVDVFQQIAERLDEISDVRGTAVSTGFPLFRSSGASIGVAGGQRSATDPVAGVRHFNAVTSDYLGTMRIPVIAGRMFTEAEDRAGAPVGLVSESIARSLFPGESPIGKLIDWEDRRDTVVRLTVIGITPDLRPSETNRRPDATLYVPSSLELRGEAAEADRSSNFVVVRTTLPPDAIGEIAQSVAPDVLVTVQSMEDRIAGRVGVERFRTTLFSGFAGIAVLLASVGVFTVLSYLVGRRTQEFGVRMALGADRRAVFAQVFRQALPPAATGLIIGLGVAYALRESLAAYTFRISVTDAPTYAFVTLLLSMVIVAACAVPAHRASRMDPLTALRHE